MRCKPLHLRLFPRIKNERHLERKLSRNLSLEKETHISCHPFAVFCFVKNKNIKFINMNGSVPHTNGVNGVNEIKSNGTTCNGKSSVPTKVVEGLEGVEKAAAQEYLNNYKAHQTGISHEKMVEVYTTWAPKYDQDLRPGIYNGPEIAAAAMATYYPETRRGQIEILDVAAGTGRVGEEMGKKGFRIMDALEPSPGMLNVLLQRNCYRNTFQTPIGHDPVTVIKPNTYDSLVIAGGMGEGHIPVKAVDEMIRVVKPGGTIFIIMREEYLSYVQEYVGKLEPYMQEKEKKGLWKQISRNIVPSYSFNKNGVVFCYQVLETS